MSFFITRRPNWMRNAFGLDPNYEVPRELSELILPTVDITKFPIRPAAISGVAIVGGGAPTALFTTLAGRSMVLQFVSFTNGAGVADDFILELTDGTIIVEVERVTVPGFGRAHLRDYIGDARLLLAPPGFSIQVRSNQVGTATGLGWNYEELSD